MWTCENRPKCNRDKLRYPSDLTGEEWAHIEPLIPPAKHGGRKRGGPALTPTAMMRAKKSTARSGTFSPIL